MNPGMPARKEKPPPPVLCRLCQLPHAVGVFCVYAQQVAMKKLLQKIAEKFCLCDACRVQLYFVRHANGALAPYTEAGLNHFIDCPDRDNFTRTPKPRKPNPPGSST